MGCPRDFFIQLALCLIYFLLNKCDSVIFEKDWIGVSFSPYVKIAEGNNPIPGLTSYTFENLQTMINVVSSKFTYLLADEAGAFNDNFHKEGTYYHDSLVIARTAEAAALFNRGRMNKTELRVIIGVNINDEKATTLTQMQLAKEAYNVADHIHINTAEGVVFTTTDDRTLMNLKSILLSMNIFPNVAGVFRPGRSEDIRIGAAIFCNDFLLSHFDNQYSAEIYRAKWGIVLKSDFVICKQEVGRSMKSTLLLLHNTSANFLQYRQVLKQINKNVNVMGWTAYDGKENKSSIENLQQFWIGMNAFAKENQFRIYMYEAFDNSNRKDTRLLKMGWWRLKGNHLINNVSGYVEKVNDYKETALGEEENSELIYVIDNNVDDTHMHVYISISGGVVALVIVLILICIMQNKFKVFSKYIVRSEIQRRWDYESFTARSLSTSARRIYVTETLGLPHEKSHIISKDRFEEHKEILKDGEYTYSCKAFLKNNSRPSSTVFLKSSKAGCPSNLLKSIIAESKILSYLGHHKNIVSICGLEATSVENRIVHLATEFCSMGTLKNCLMAVAEEDLVCHLDVPYDNLFRWSYDIASGMEYLEEKDVAHNNLASKNIFVNSDKVAKISCFNQAKRLYGYAALNGFCQIKSDPSMWKWLAPEALLINEFSIQSDIWSFGITLWEIFTLGKEPYDNDSGNHEFIQSLQKGLRPAPAQHACDYINQVMTECWNQEPMERPSFSELKLLIQFLLRKHDR